MGFETYTWKCKFCGKLHIWNKKYKYCNCCDYKPNLKTMKSIEKEKAEELIEKFYYIKSNSEYFGVNWEIAKKCALIAVEEILEIIRYHGTDIGKHSLLFWKEVKQQIIKL